MNWLRQRWLITKFYWRCLWMTRAKREQAKAMWKILSNLLANAPMKEILARESCPPWTMTPKQTAGALTGVEEYVKIVKGEDIRFDRRKIPVTEDK